MSDAPLAYFLTFRCYATWLHGDARGSMSKRANAPGEPPIAPNPTLEAAERRSAGPPGHLDTPSRACVEQAILEVVQARGWGLHALNVRTNHVHLVVSGIEPPERMLVTLKGWATRRLRSDGLIEARARVWSRHGSTRYLWTDEEVERACQYVKDGQGDGEGE